MKNINALTGEETGLTLNCLHPWWSQTK